MENNNRIESIIEKLNRGLLFGLFEDGNKCYFQDGVRESYTDLWIAVRRLYGLPARHNRTLAEICKETFVGNYSYKASKHKWIK